MSEQLKIALINSITIKWLNKQNNELIQLIRETYAKELDCPLCEVCEEFTTNDELSWVYKQFTIDIEETARLSRNSN